MKLQKKIHSKPLWATFMVLAILCINSISLVSAWEWDNVKDYNSNTKTITITNAFGLGKDIAYLTLLTPPHNRVFPGEDILVAKIQVNLLEDYSSPFNKMDFYDYKSLIKKEKEFNYKYSDIIFVNINDTKTNCIILGNKSQNCTTLILDKTHKEEKKIWKEFNEKTEVLAKKYEIGLFTNVLTGERTEWIPTFFGVEITEWADFSALNYQNVNISIGGEDTDPFGIFFKPDGLKTYMIGIANDSIHQYNLSDAWNISSVTSEQKNFSVTTQDNLPIGIHFNSDGTKMFVLGYNNKKVFQYSLTEAWNVSSASYDSVDFSHSVQVDASTGFNFNSAGTKMYVYGDSRNLYQYTLTAWDLSTASYDNKNYNFSSPILLKGVAFNSSGGKAIIADFSNKSFSQYSLGTDYDITTLTSDNTQYNITNAFGGYVENIRANFWGENDNKLYLSGATGNRIYQFDFGGDLDPTVSLSIPANNYSTISPDITFNCSAIDDNAVINLSLYIDDVLNTTIYNTTDNQSLSLETSLNFGIGEYNWTCIAFDDISQEGTTDTRNFSSVILVINSQTYNSSTYEGNSEDFIANITYDSSTYGISANLNYNGTDYTGTKTGTGNNVSFTKTLIIPNVVSETNISFYWSFILIDGGTTITNTSVLNQTVKQIQIDDCSSYTHEIFNFTLMDEELKTEIDGSVYNSSIEITLNLSLPSDTSISTTYSNNFSSVSNVRICMENLTFGNYIEATIKYGADDYVVEYYFLENYLLENVSSKLPNNINLYDLLSDDSTSYLLTYQDCNYLTGKDKLIQTWRRYVDDGNFLLVEMSRTDIEGQAVAHLVSEDIIYKFVVTDDGEIEWETDSFNALCISTPCQISIKQICDVDDFIDYTQETDFTYSLTKNSGTRTIQLTYSIPSGASADTALNVTKLDYLMNSSICTETQTGAGGTLTCVIPSTLTNTTYYVEVFKNDEFVTKSYFSLSTSAVDTFGVWGVVLSGFLILTFGLMFIATGWGVVVGAVLGLIVSATLSLVAFNWTMLIWLCVAMAIIIYKISKKSGSG